MTATIAGFLAACDRMARPGSGYFYDNSGSRCKPFPYKGRDCSTFAAEALIDAGYENVNPCANSYEFARICFDAVRPDWFIQRFGPGQGTFITHEQALWVLCFGLEGQDWGREPFANNRAHIEVGLGNGGGSVGAHSHSSGVGYSQLDVHNLNYWAVPPWFLPEMAPPPWKVAPMYHPTMDIAAELKNPQGGRWEARPNGTVRLITPKGDVVEGGMTSTVDRNAFAGRQVAQLHLRWYKPKGKLLRKAGFTIEATSGEKYVPSAQH